MPTLCDVCGEEPAVTIARDLTYRCLGHRRDRDAARYNRDYRRALADELALQRALLPA